MVAYRIPELVRVSCVIPQLVGDSNTLTMRNPKEPLFYFNRVRIVLDKD